MSKKKATMTLKDFHGGCIPSDLSLPSAPGVMLRPTDRSGYDRPNTLGGSAGRADYRVRPNSSPAARHFDDKTPFLSHNAHIGRNFDEDERKPLDGSSAPRRMISDESFHFHPSRVELKSETISGGKGVSRGLGSQVVGLYSGVVSEGGRSGPNMQNVGDVTGQSIGASFPNAWTARKESAMGVNGVVQSATSEVSMISKMAHASALDKVSSGRWRTEHSLHHQVDVEIIDHSETEKAVRDLVYGKECVDVTLPRHMERAFTVEDGNLGGRKELFDDERVRAPLYSEINDQKPLTDDDRVQLPRTEVKFSGSAFQPVVQSEAQERPKVKLLPRTKLLENFDTSYTDHKQGYQQSSNLAHGPMESTNELQANFRTEKPSFAGIESENRVAERPKLNLKPRSQSLEQSEGNGERERNALFGGARPRELVLKDRGMDDTAVSSHDLGRHSDRVKHNIPRTEKEEQAVPARSREKVENPPVDHRTGKKFERTDQRNDADRVDMQRRNNCRNGLNGKDTGRQQQQQQRCHVIQERPPSPETWRKPEQPKISTPDAIAMRYSKAASALDLAQTFSRSVSNPKTTDTYAFQKGLPSSKQVPFSRLVDANTRPKINGY